MINSNNDKARKKKHGHGPNVSKMSILKLNAKFVLINQSSITVQIVCGHKFFVSFKKSQLKIS